MFPLHERTRRFICRTLFILCGALPTATVLGWCICVNSSSQATAIRADLESVLGLKVQLTQVSFPRPGCTLIEDLQLADPESGDTVATMRHLEIYTSTQRKTFIASQPEINLAATARLGTLIDGWLHRGANSLPPDVRLSASDLTLRWPDGAQTFVDGSIQLVSSATGNFIEAAVSPADLSSPMQPIVLHIERSSLSGQPATSVKLQAESVPLPCSLLAALLQRENRCGPSATFRGTLNALETPDGWQAELAGQLQNIDLHSLVSEQFPHQMSGAAEARIDRALFHAGRLEEAAGSIHAGPGSVSPSLLAAAVAWLGLERGAMVNRIDATPGNTVPYEEFSADFDLHAGGLSLHGTCGDKHSGILLRNGPQSLLADSNRGPAPIVALVKMLVPDSRLQVPATRQTDWLLRMLPVPDVVPGDPQAVPQARLRGGKDLH